MLIYRLPLRTINRMLNGEEIFNIFDSHTIPQFWYMISLSQNYNVEFNIQSISMLKNVHPSIKKINTKSISLEISDNVRNKLIHFYTEDVVLYDQFLNSVSDINKIIGQIKLEKTFINDLQQYKRQLTYLL